MADGIVHDEASVVAHSPGRVTVQCPDGASVTLTPEAAARTGGRLLEHAAAASGERALDAEEQARREDGREDRAR